MTPLTEEALGKLVPGKSVLRHRLGAVGVVNGPIGGGRLVMREIGHEHHIGDWCHLFTLIGTLTEDGWIAWSGGENPVEDMVVEAMRRDGRIVTKAARKFDWLHSPSRTDPADIIAFRPAQREAEGQLSGISGELQSCGEQMVCGNDWQRRLVTAGLPAEEQTQRDLQRITGHQLAQPEPATGGEVDEWADLRHFAEGGGSMITRPQRARARKAMRQALAALGKTSREVG